MHYILDARTILQRVEVMMTYYYRAGIALVQFFKQSSHGYLLSLCSRIFGLTSDVKPSLVADAYRVGIVVLAVGTCQPFRTARLYISVTTDHVVVADTELPALAAMPRIYLSSRALLVRPHCRTVDYQHRYASHNSSLLTIHFSLSHPSHAACCSEGCENSCCDARYELYDPLQGFFLSHNLPPYFLLFLGSMLFPDRLLHVAVATGLAACALTKQPGAYCA